MSVGRAGAAGGGRKDSVAAATVGARGRVTSRGREEGRWKVEAKVHTLAQEVQRLAQKCDKGNQDVALLEDALKQDGEEVGLGNNKWLFGKLERDRKEVGLGNNE